MLGTHALTIGVSLLVAFAAQAQPVTLDVLDEYAHHPGSERLNTPTDEIEWLRKHQLIHGELDDFPQAAIILHRVDVERYLKELGFEGYYKSFSYGFTDPVLVFVVRRPGMRPFAVVRGLPGAGGVTTEAAELHGEQIRSSMLEPPACCLPRFPTDNWLCPTDPTETAPLFCSKTDQTGRFLDPISR